MRKNVADVMNAFFAGSDRGGETVSTRNGVVYSYSMPIAAYREGVYWCADDGPTQTTKVHLGSMHQAFSQAGLSESVRAVSVDLLEGFIIDGAAAIVALDADLSGDHAGATLLRKRAGIATQPDIHGGLRAKSNYSRYPRVAGRRNG